MHGLNKDIIFPLQIFALSNNVLYNFPEQGVVPVLYVIYDPGAAGFTGSTVIAEFESLEAAQAWADADPYVAAGVYEHVSVKPFKKVF